MKEVDSPKQEAPRVDLIDKNLGFFAALAMAYPLFVLGSQW